MSDKRILSGMQPTNQLHLGNYLGALRNWVKMQDDNPDAECLFCAVDLHAVTTGFKPDTLAQSCREIAAAYIAAGIDPEKSSIFVQSSVPAHSEMMWLLSCMTPMGWLKRMTQFKEKAGKKQDNAFLGLFAYPVLMAADILIYKSTHVPVGEDQKQHLELARDIATSFNVHYNGEKEFFPLPEPMIMGEATRVMSLRDGTSKMSKSAESDMTRINLTDDAELIAKKISKAKSDSGVVPCDSDEAEGRPEVQNLINIYAALSDRSFDEVAGEYGGQQFSAFKKALTELAVDKLAPITTRMNELMDHPEDIDQILLKGAARANELAQPTVQEMRDLVGFWKP